MKKAVGEQELAVLRYVAEHGPVTVAEVAERFGEAQGLARSTIITVMERLRKKSYLTRGKVEGVFQYRSPVPASELLRGVVDDFVERTLAGSLSPFVTYLAEAEDVSEEELQQLQDVVARLQSRKQHKE